MNYVAARMREPSTHLALVTIVLTGLRVVFPAYAAAIDALGAAVAAAYAAKPDARAG